MTRALLPLINLLGIATCCAFFSASCAAAWWRSRARGHARLRAMGVLLASSFFSALMFSLVMGGRFAPWHRLWVSVEILMSAAMAAGAWLAVRHGTVREVLTATGWCLVVVCLSAFIPSWWLPPMPPRVTRFLLPAVVVAVVPALLGQVLTPILLVRALPPTAGFARKSSGA